MGSMTFLWLCIYAFMSSYMIIPVASLAQAMLAQPTFASSYVGSSCARGGCATNRVWQTYSPEVSGRVFGARGAVGRARLAKVLFRSTWSLDGCACCLAARSRVRRRNVNGWCAIKASPHAWRNSIRTKRQIRPQCLCPFAVWWRNTTPKQIRVLIAVSQG